MTRFPPPMSLLAELTHRCPLACPYCSNPLSLDRRQSELETQDWVRILEEAAALGVLQVHFSGGEPMARADLPALVHHASSLNLYTNLITSGVLITQATLAALDEAGLDHIQLSFQDVTETGAERIGGLRGAQERKLAAARLIRARGLPLTLNFVIHRENADRVAQMLDLAHELGAGRVEIAHTQYYGWGLKNRDLLMPSAAQLDAATDAVVKARARFGNSLAIDYVTPDYHADQPKPCMGGWGQRFLNVTPSGKVLPCHAAETIPDVTFPNVMEHALGEIWQDSALFNLFRGTAWMPEPCQSCALKEIDWGGCRCQALALTGDARATDPVCARSDRHEVVVAAAEAGHDGDFAYRRFTGTGRNETG
ncbi:pyrroloquinoline quinone biosynthesis protein PqqE [Swaminathania salitolerans]|uniref:PqqA peptide cyclase n=1 Tax=Swaminathania salitolerans TaxID=182838 RepID=A0A511BQX8_9PROT|nr:pyrroloquinoline quinone biosynthesis protein PqqE [Swaminathania salitolerans]GBQ12157.1 pyrroloquinoline quinone biosynthesis protein PqqE [Swaminathania salitolerans LMG 21291]GEL02751.1 coenzyme PQQ synthesis protein E [Swaminathania salitolerans]